MIPYIHLPDIKLGPIPVHWFGLLVATGVFIGIGLVRWRAKKLGGYDTKKLESFMSWMLVSGFVGAHVIDWIFYHPDELARKPWTILFIWEGISSFGGFIGGLVGVLLWKKFVSKGERILPYADLIMSVFPISWIFGRSGCAVVHDHPGKLSDSPLAVQFPGGSRFDLGLLEAMFAVVLSLIVISFWGKKRPDGFYIALCSILYAPVRFGLDFLRVPESTGPDADRRYFDLTMAQWTCVGLLIFGVVMAVRLTKRRGEGLKTP
jgi:phosphatidylglycerol:prolipoprotein diacylglycerol transferase